MVEIDEILFTDFSGSVAIQLREMIFYMALGDDMESRRGIDERLRMMERFGLVVIDREEVKTK